MGRHCDRYEERAVSLALNPAQLYVVSCASCHALTTAPHKAVTPPTPSLNPVVLTLCTRHVDAPPRRRDLRQRLHGARESAPLFDHTGWMRTFEDALRMMWGYHCDFESPPRVIKLDRRHFANTCTPEPPCELAPEMIVSRPRLSLEPMEPRPNKSGATTPRENGGSRAQTKTYDAATKPAPSDVDMAGMGAVQEGGWEGGVASLKEATLELKTEPMDEN